LNRGRDRPADRHEGAWVENVEAHIADAVKRGRHGGSGRQALGGRFFEPTVLTDVTTDMVITK
jgi:succinate-semialdehyde dehydrogenase/glutarate-semialdehyde dehydrogenase